MTRHNVQDEAHHTHKTIRSPAATCRLCAGAGTAADDIGAVRRTTRSVRDAGLGRAL